MDQDKLNSRQKRQVKLIQKQINKKQVKRDQISSTKISTIPLPLRFVIFFTGIGCLIASFINEAHPVLLFISGTLLILIGLFGFRKALDKVFDGLNCIDCISFFDFS